MARLADAATLTAHLGTLTDELYREVTERSGDLPTMIELADRISESADELATALSCMNDALNTALSKHAPADVVAPAPAASALSKHAPADVVAPAPAASALVGSVAANGDRRWSLTKWAKNDVRRLTNGARRVFTPASRPDTSDADATPAWERPRRHAALVPR